jgi:hypothetical protein
MIDVTSESSTDYGLSVPQIGQMWSAMDTLRHSNAVTIWPDHRDLLMAGSKLVYLEYILGKSASSMGHFHPKSTRVNPSEELVERIAQHNYEFVLKREYSSHCVHVFTKHTEGAATKFAELIGKEAKAYSKNRNSSFCHPAWFLQPYNPALIHLGEIRVFVVNGVIYKQVVTTPKAGNIGKLDIQEPGFLTPLSKLW